MYNICHYIVQRYKIIYNTNNNYIHFTLLQTTQNMETVEGKPQLATGKFAFMKTPSYETRVRIATEARVL